MIGSGMSSLNRVLTAIGHKEPDRVPFLLTLSLHGAKELELSIKEYFSKSDNVVEGQLRLRSKYRHDFIYAFFYAAIEIEAWGGEVIFVDDGPPNSGRPFLQKSAMIKSLTPPRIYETGCLKKVLDAISKIKSRIGEGAPIVGVVMSPFSLPVMQMGFDKYLELIYEDRTLFDQLMKVNEEFCVSWANAQLEAGATAICCFDPVSSATILTREVYLETGFQVAKRTIARIKGPTVVHMASGACLPIIDDLAKTGTNGVGVSVIEDLGAIKNACRGKLAVLGNLNGIEMRHWTRKQAEQQVKDAIAKAGRGGGYILSDNHGEIPWQVPDEVLMAISDAVYKWGQYPLDWINYGG